MKKNLFFLMIIMIGCTNTQREQPENTIEYDTNMDLKRSDSAEVVMIVNDFFKTFDERDLQKMSDILGPAMKIVHHNGATTSREEMIEIIKETKNWWPRTRKLSEVEFIAIPDMAIVGVLNEVTFSLPKNKTVEERYRETWIFKKVEKQWKPVRCHYSKIIVDKHTEEVN